MEISEYKHKYSLRVRNYEIDWQGIVHNGNYLLYFEVARVDYFKHVGMEIDERAITGKTKIVIVRNELDYFSTCTFDDPLVIYSRIQQIRNSSITCCAEIFHETNNKRVAKNISTLVWLDPSTNMPMRVPEYFRYKVYQFEGDTVSIEWSKKEN